MTAETVTNRNDPIVPTSPPAKRIKTDVEPAANNSETMTFSSNGTTQRPGQPPPLLIKKLSDKARLPTRGSAFAAGYDLYASRDTVIPARGKALVETDISMAVPAGTCKAQPQYLPPGFSRYGHGIRKANTCPLQTDRRPRRASLRPCRQALH